MKTVPLFLNCSLLVVALFLAFVNAQSKMTTQTTKTASNLAMCSSPSTPAIPDAKLFDPNEYKLPAVLIRKNIASFTAADMTSLKTGITAMKALPVTNKTSWLYQAAMSVLPNIGADRESFILNI